jgi:hypothetical protein
LINMFIMAIILISAIIIICLVYHFLNIKKAYKVVVTLIFSFIILLILLNPGRASFNNAIFENRSNLIAKNKETMKDIYNVNLKDYNNGSHPLIKRRYYLLFSIYDVHASDNKVYHIFGFLESFKLIS